MVWSYFEDIFLNEKYEWRLPNFFKENQEFLKSALLDQEKIKEYCIMHDCGKPFCLITDKEGKRHFPDHSNVSFEVYKATEPENTIIQELIKRDMEIHLLKKEEVPFFCKDPKMAITLLVVGICEINANACLFGGTNSTSFKIKMKHIEKKGKLIIDYIKNQRSLK